MKALRGGWARAVADGTRLSSWRQLAWQYPEWWVIALSVIAWPLLVMQAHPAPITPSQALAHQGHHHEAPAASGAAIPAWLPELGIWMLMVVAMMLPLVLGAARHAAVRSLWRRRTRAIGGFLVGYLAVWLLAGIPALLLSRALGLNERARLIGAVAIFAIAAVWQLTPLKERLLLSCHRTAPLAPGGWRADRDCLRYGWLIGGFCLGSCWAMMLACALAGHHPLLMIGVGAIGATERYLPRPDQRIFGGLLLGLAVVAVALS